MAIRCGCCGGPLAHIDDACPTCLPGWPGLGISAGRVTATEVVIAQSRMLAKAFAEGERAGRAAEREACARLVENRGPATQDMTSTMICDALDDAAAAIRARAGEAER